MEQPWLVCERCESGPSGNRSVKGCDPQTKEKNKRGFGVSVQKQS